jgi:DNA-binding NarL/FixJ family response regulator
MPVGSSGILIAEGHAGLRQRMRSLLEEAGFDICGEARTGQEAIAKSAELQPSLVIIDVFTAVMNGIKVIPQIVRSGTTQVLATSIDESLELKEQAILLGAAGYVSKSSLATELVAEVTRLLAPR